MSLRAPNLQVPTLIPSRVRSRFVPGFFSFFFFCGPLLAPRGFPAPRHTRAKSTESAHAPPQQGGSRPGDLLKEAPGCSLNLGWVTAPKTASFRPKTPTGRAGEAGRALPGDMAPPRSCCPFLGTSHVLLAVQMLPSHSFMRRGPLAKRSEPGPSSPEHLRGAGQYQDRARG